MRRTVEFFLLHIRKVQFEYIHVTPARHCVRLAPHRDEQRVGVAAASAGSPTPSQRLWLGLPQPFTFSEIGGRARAAFVRTGSRGTAWLPILEETVFSGGQPDLYWWYGGNVETKKKQQTVLSAYVRAQRQRGNELSRARDVDSPIKRWLHRHCVQSRMVVLFGVVKNKIK